MKLVVGTEIGSILQSWINSSMGTDACMQPFLTSFVLDLVAMAVFRLKLLMLVIMKALLLLYIIDS